MPTQKGDPQGIRIALRNARQANASLRFLHAASSCCVGNDELVGLLNDCQENIKQYLIRQEQLAKGHVGPRETKRGRSNNVRMARRPVLNIFIDESGQATLENLKQPVFVLSGVAITNEELQKFKVAADSIKYSFLGHVNVAFHEPDIRKAAPPFDFDGDQEKQHRFRTELESLVDSSQFSLFSVAIRKDQFLEQFKGGRVDHYLPQGVYYLAFSMLLERIVDFLSNNPIAYTGKIFVESIGPKEEAVLQRTLAQVLLEGTQFVSERSFREWLSSGCHFTVKEGSCGSELADLAAREVYEWAQGGCGTRSDLFDRLLVRYHARGDGERGRHGLKVFPDEGVRHQVQDARSISVSRNLPDHLILKQSASTQGGEAPNQQ